MAKKKKQKPMTFLDIYQSCRKFWPISPVQKVLPNKKKKSRAKIKREFKMDLRDEI